MAKRKRIGTDTAKRVARTGAQLAIPTLFVQGWNLFASHPMTSEQTNWIIAVGTLLIGLIQNALEEQGFIAGFLKGAPPTPPTNDLDTREILALASEMADQRARSERLENALLDLRADRRPAEPEDLERIVTRRQEAAAAWPPGGLG